MLAWRLQAEALGGLSPPGPAACLRRRGAIAPEGRALGDGAILRRDWQGRRIEVVVEGGWLSLGGAGPTRASPPSPARPPGPAGTARASSDCARADNEAARPRRCAIYTRKSSEEGLEQSFNSLDAQREACDCLYQEPGERRAGGPFPPAMTTAATPAAAWSGPASSSCSADIALEKIDIVVVYKIDRLTRSLADFARMVELFEQHDVSFVSVTQSFNTTSSMGRLTLNVLLSFAQFEREVTGERIRDKIAASKKKGMWMGGSPPLGYDLPEAGSHSFAGE